MNDERTKTSGPSCLTCVHADACGHQPVEAVRDRVFCAQWQSREPEPKGEDPNDLWNRGEESEFG